MCIHFYRLLKSKLCVKSNITSMLMNKCKQSLWTSTIKFAKSSPNPMLIKPVRSQYSIQELARRYDKQILFSSTFEQQKVKLGYRRNKAAEAKAAIKRENAKTKLQTESPIPVTLKYLCEDQKSKDDDDAESKVINIESTKNDEPVVQFPFESFEKNENLDVRKPSTSKEYESIEQEVSERNKYHNDIQNWMTDYENFDDKTINWKANYGTPDPKTPVSSVACGGCGSLLHCKDSSIPGYLPSEIFKSHRLEGGQRLSTLICQRCHFLKHYDMALQVRVSPEDYPRILHTINENRNALVIVMVDLLDFPCSVWPDIINIIGRKKPVVVVGNKIDLLPQDSRGYLNRIQQILANNIGRSDLNEANIQHVALISAKTGYGVEELITKLHNIWKYRGDVYLVGCTNVGKSTLFNALLQSDYCKIKAGDLIQRATTSIWPGTTLNLLKFPILRPSGWRLFVRTKRLMSLNKLTSQENKIRKSQLMKTKNPKYATLMGHIERTFTSEEPEDDERKDIFSVQGRATASGKSRCGINENEPQYKLSKWCYDTPGVVQPDQILHLLTTEELMLTLPKQLIQPRTFNVKPGLTMFVAGLGRLDFIEGPLSIRFTVFASENLPVTICLTENADTLYSELIGTEILRVPMGNEDRLQKWPALESSDDIYLTGEDWETSCADIVLSSAGWIAVSLGSEQTCKLKAWTPEKRGIVVRNSILPKAVSLRGRRVRHSPAYKKTRYFSNEIK